MKLKLSSFAAAAVLSVVLMGCGSSSSDNGEANTNSRLAYLNAMGQAFKADMNGLNDIWKDTTSTRTVAFKAKDEASAAAEIIQGAVDIADEVGNSKMSAPFGTDITQDVTKVESQFSWNSTNDFYNNIYSIKKVWDTGLKAIAERHGVATTIEAKIDDTLLKISAISDLTIVETIAGTYVIPQAKAFRNQMLAVDEDEDGIDNPQNDDTTSRGKIRLAIEACQALQALLETLKTDIASKTLATADKTNLDAIVDDTIRTGYATMIVGADALAASLTTLKADGSATNVTAARTAWRKVRSAWESSEAYIVATAPTVGDSTDGNVDSWPVPTKTDIENNLKEWDGKDQTIIDTDGDKKGFHGIEYFLFGNGEAEESAADAATRLKKD